MPRWRRVKKRAAIDADGKTAASAWISVKTREFTVQGLPKGRFTLRASRWQDEKFEVLGETESVAAGSIDVELRVGG